MKIPVRKLQQVIVACTSNGCFTAFPEVEMTKVHQQILIHLRLVGYATTGNANPIYVFNSPVKNGIQLA